MAVDSSRRPSGSVMMVGAGLGWAMLELVGHRLSAYAPLQVVWSRYAVHLVLLILVPGRRAPVWKTRRPGLHTVSALAMIGMPLCFLHGIRASSVGNTWAVFWLAPLVTLALGAVLLRERPTGWSWAASILAVSGCALVYAERPLPGPRGIFWGIGMAVCFAVYLVVARRLRDELTETKLFYVALGAFLALTPAMPGRFVLPSEAGMAGMAAIGAIGLASLFLIDRALERESLAHLGPWIVAAVPSGVLLEALFTGGVGLRAALGAFLVTGALAVAALRGGSEASPRPEVGQP